MKLFVVIWLLALGACKVRTDLTTDAPVGDACSGDEIRCVGTILQECVGDVFVDHNACANACVESLGGCIDCDPAASINTCNGADVVACNPDGTFGTLMETCGEGTECKNGSCRTACTADGVDLVYVVDEDMHFLSFDPRKLPADPFTMIGTLDCPVTGPSIQIPAGPVTPFSMSVDNDGIAWVEYSSGEIFNVSLTDASCTATGYVPQAAGMNLFGMGFVSDDPNTDAETLYIVGGGQSAEPNGQLATVDTHNAMYTPQLIGGITQPSDFSPELTGTNEGKVYGFYPIITTGPAYVQEIDKTTGGPVGPTFDLGTTGLGGAIRDWAFAQWGNKFYIFITTQDGTGTRNSTVRSIDKTTGTYTIELENLPFFIPGAGVSTCAPSVLQ